MQSSKGLALASVFVLLACQDATGAAETVERNYSIYSVNGQSPDAALTYASY